MREITRKAWEVFRSAFKDGEDVIVERDDGKFFWGKLTARDDDLMLTRPGGRDEFFDWDEIEFMAHDGFPVKHLMGMSIEEAESRAEQTNADVIRALLDRTLKRQRRLKPVPTPSPPPRRYGGGCPWIIDDDAVEVIAVHNPGNRGPKFAYWDMSDAGETFVFRAADGALMHNYDSDHLFAVA